MIYSNKVKKVAEDIGQFFLQKNSKDYKKASEEIERLRILNIDFLGNHKIIIETSRPGLLIGMRGEQVKQLVDFLKLEVVIKEPEDDLLYHMTPREEHYDFEGDFSSFE